MSETANYSESAVSGTSWKRACRVFIENPLGGTPSLMIVEEDAINLGGKIINQVVANLSVPFDASEADHLTVYNALNSIYIKAREARDAVIVVPEPIP
jgi:hypothetical protein